MLITFIAKASLQLTASAGGQRDNVHGSITYSFCAATTGQETWCACSVG